MAAHAGHTAETLRRAADPRSHASARRARHRLTRSQPAPAPTASPLSPAPAPCASPLRQPPAPCPLRQPPAPCASPQPRHGKEDMWSPQSDVLDDSTLSQTQKRTTHGWLAPTPTPHSAPASPHSGELWPSPARSSQRHHAPPPRPGTARRPSPQGSPAQHWQVGEDSAGHTPSPRTRWQVLRCSRAVRHSPGSGR